MNLKNNSTSKVDLRNFAKEFTKEELPKDVLDVDNTEIPKAEVYEGFEIDTTVG